MMGSQESWRTLRSWWTLLTLLAVGASTGAFPAFGSAAANDVSVRVVGSEVLVQGDAGPNQVIVRQAANGSLTIFGRGGTLVNGSSAVTISSAVNSLEMRMGAGDDRVVLQNLSLPGDLDIYLGAGNNRVAGQSGNNIVGCSVDIYGGDQRDIVTLANWTVGGDLDIDLFNGSSQVNVQNSTIGRSLGVYGGNQADRVTLGELSVGIDVDVETFSSRDIVNISAVGARSLDVLTGNGVDEVMLSNLVLSTDLDVLTGNGDDSVAIDAVLAERDVDVLLGAGNDVLVVAGLTAFRELLLNGQLGEEDTLIASGLEGGEEISILGFEIEP